jgi:transposase
MSQGTRRKFDKEFKMETARLMAEGGRKPSDLARDLDIHENVLRKWRQQYLQDAKGAFPGKGHLNPIEDENRRLKKELNDIKEERDILKKALAIFSKHPK